MLTQDSPRPIPPPKRTAVLVIAVTQYNLGESWNLAKNFAGSMVPVLNWLNRIGVQHICFCADVPDTESASVKGLYQSLFSASSDGIRAAVRQMVDFSAPEVDTLLVIWQGHGLMYVDGAEGFSRRLLIQNANSTKSLYNISTGGLQAALGAAKQFTRQIFIFDACASLPSGNQGLAIKDDLGEARFHAGQTTVWAAPLGNVANFDRATGRSYLLTALLNLYKETTQQQSDIWFPELLTAEGQWERLINGLSTTPVFQAALNAPNAVRLFQSESSAGKVRLGDTKEVIAEHWGQFCEMMLYKEFLSELYSQCLQPMQVAAATLIAKNTEDERREFLNSIKWGARIRLNVGVARNKVGQLMARYHGHMPPAAANFPRDAYQTILNQIWNQLDVLAKSSMNESTFEWLGGFASLYYEVVEAMEGMEEGIQQVQARGTLREIAVALGKAIETSSETSSENTARLLGLGDYLMRIHRWLDDLLVDRRLWQQARVASFGFRVVPTPPAQSYRTVIQSLYRKICTLEDPFPVIKNSSEQELFRAGDFFVDMDFQCFGLDAKNLTSCAEFFEYVNAILCACTDYCSTPPPPPIANTPAGITADSGNTSAGGIQI